MPVGTLQNSVSCLLSILIQWSISCVVLLPFLVFLWIFSPALHELYSSIQHLRWLHSFGNALSWCSSHPAPHPAIYLSWAVLHHWDPSYLISYNLEIYKLYISFTVVVAFNQEKNFTELYEECRRISVAEKVYSRQETNRAGNSVFLSYFTKVEWEHQTIAFCSHKKSLVYLK